MSDQNTAQAFLAIPTDFVCQTNSDLVGWLIQHCNEVGSQCWLLAYADDGVIWGKIDDHKMVTAADVFNTEYPGAFPVLNMDKLQKASLFGERAEIRLFRRNGSWSALRIEENPAADESDSFVRSYLLWGNRVKARKDGWTWVEDGQLGIHQALPLEITDKISHRIMRIDIRYYIDYEKDHGQALIAAKRLCNLFTIGEE